MPGLVPGIHVFVVQLVHENVDGRDKPGHDKCRAVRAWSLRRGWGDVRTPLVGVIVMAGVVMRGIA